MQSLKLLVTMNPMITENEHADTFDQDTYLVTTNNITYDRSDEEASEQSSENGAITPYRFFEGAEKRLVLYLSAKSDDECRPVPDLRKISR